MQDRTEKILEYIHENLTDEQRDVCFFDGSNSVVYACPGSGKTMTVGTRFALRMSQWQARKSGIAVLSFTNVAWMEIGKQLQKLGFTPKVSWPHFLGTIHSFVHQYVLAPFGHVAMGSKRRPEVVIGENATWLGRKYMQSNFQSCRMKCMPCFLHLNKEGNVFFRRVNRKAPTCFEGCDSPGIIKAAMAKRGYATAVDSMYWGMKVLENKAICRAIACRFSELIIDEAQDTSEMQVEILERLRAAGSRITLVGDPDQAIFSFNNARPDLFEAYAERADWSVHKLTKCFRSSQHICNSTVAFSNRLTEPAIACGKTKEYPKMPVLTKYAEGDIKDLVGEFKDMLVEQEISSKKSAILARRHETILQILGGKHIDWPKTTVLNRVFAKAAVLRDRGVVGQAHEVIMWGMLKLCFDEGSFGACREVISGIGWRNWKKETWKLLLELPISSTQLSEWVVLTKGIVEKFLVRVQWPCAASSLGRVFQQCNHSTAIHPICDFVKSSVENDGLTMKVIHQAKGETYDAVMVVAGKGRRGGRSDLEQWLEPNNADEKDERRVGYVAMTRPRKLLFLTVPEDEDVASIVGFEARPKD